MSEKKGWGDTVLGWFIERDGDKALQTPAEEADPPPAPTPVVLAGDLPLPSRAGAPLDFPAVYRAAGIPEEAQDRVAKAMQLLATLPAEASREVKRQIVEASLKAFGFPVEQILEAAAAETQALRTFAEFGERNTREVVAQAEQRIEALNREIAEVRALTEEKQAAQQQLTEACRQQERRLREVLDFFAAQPARGGAEQPPPGEAPAT